MAWLLQLIDRLMALLYPPMPPQPIPEPPKQPPAPPSKSKGQILYETAFASLHKDMSPADHAPDSLACMESVDGVWLAAFGEHLLPLPGRLSTNAGYKAMRTDQRLKEVDAPQAGDIVISPTGYSTTGAQHGHVGIWGNHDVMSNDSNTGLFTDNYTHQAWYNVFSKTLGFPVKFFRPV